MEDYLKQEILDPVPNLHVKHGARIIGPVPNYRPLDHANDGFGVLCLYDLKTREVKSDAQVYGETELTRETIENLIDRSILEMLEVKSRYTRTTPLMDLGIDSLQLMELRSLISGRFLLPLAPTFFFQYGTAQEAIDYVVSKKLEPYKEWLYQVKWKPQEILEQIPLIPDRLWIIFGDNAQIAEKLREHQQYCIVAESEIDRRFLSKIPNLKALAGVIFVADRSDFKDEPTYKEINAYLQSHCESLIRCANALALTHVPDEARLWVVTSSMTADGTGKSLLETPYSTLCKVIREEYPKSKCTCVAVDNPEMLFKELQSHSLEHNVAYREGKRYIARLEPAVIERSVMPQFSPEASYMVSGGLQPLGLKVAEWYINHGARHVILLDEGHITTEVQREINRLEAIGANITVHLTRFDDFADLKLIFNSIKVPIKGVIHSVGILSDELLMHVNWKSAENVIRVKIAGSWNLHLLTKDLSLDHFILFSSSLKDIVPFGKASGSIGNAFLDGLAHYRRKRSLPALAIDWAPWELRKMVIEHLSDINLAYGLEILKVEDGLFILDHLIYANTPQIMAVKIYWEEFLSRLVVENPLFADIPRVGTEVLREEEPIAIVGMGCRFPGGADTPEKFWHVFKEGIDAITEVPPDRWDIDAYYDPDKNAPGKMYTRYGGFIDKVDMFDPQFFGISPREAEDMDPQQRIALEVAWDALENAAIVPSSLKGSNTGVFMGICFNDYGQLIVQSGDISAVDDYFSTGNHYSVVAGRISYILGLEGPAMAIDTACSSSLVAIDNAVKHLQLGECDMALAGGVNLILAPETTINFCKSGMLAEDGRCKTFDASANGYVRSEGCGIVILKRLSDARQDNNRILAVIRSTAINQDGASTGLTVPNGQAQEKLIEMALKKAKLQGKQIDYLEAHGTGTSLGDPIEVKAIVNTYGKNRDKPLLLGSAKTNIGHAEAAAGVAGLIKCVLALEHGVIPRHLHFEKINPYISLDGIEIAKNESPLEKGIVAVSSFGFSGTNSHAILESAPNQDTASELRPEYLIVLSAQTEQGVLHQVKQLKAYLESHPNVDMDRVAYTLQMGRTHFQWRVATFNLAEAIPTRVDIDPQVVTCDTFQDAAKEYLLGKTINWQALYRSKIVPLALPTYPFERESYWAKTARKTQMRSEESYPHEILQEKHLLSNGAILLKGEIDLSRMPMFEGHRVYDMLIFPAAGFLDMAIMEGCELDNVNITSALKLTNQHPAQLNVLFTPQGENFDIQLASRKGDKYQIHLTGTLKKTQSVEVHPRTNEGCTSITNYYERMRELGLDYRGSFQGLKEIAVGADYAIGKIQVDEGGRYFLHPAIFDAGLQLAATLKDQKSGVYLPIGFDRVVCFAPLESTCYVQAERTGNIYFFDKDGKLLVACTGYSSRLVERPTFISLLSKTDSLDNLCYKIKWIGETHAGNDKGGTIYEAQEDLKPLLEWVQNAPPSKLRIWIQDPIKQAATIGFIRTFQNEHPEFQTKIIECQKSDLPYALADDSQERHIIYREGVRLVPRIEACDIKALTDTTPIHLTISQKGVLENLQLKPQTVRPPQEHEVQIKVRATGLNFRDVLNAMGLYPGQAGPLGLECVGVVTQGNGFKKGDRVMALAQDSFADFVTVDSRLAAICPEHLTDAEAATIPLVYLTVYYCLVKCAKLQKGEKVLIHAAAGGIGLAAIQVAQYLGAEIYATASPGKTSVLQAQGIKHIYNSRNTEFASQIRDMDVILNALTGEFIAESLKTLKPHGRFIEIGKRDIWTEVEMRSARPDVSYFIVALDTIMQEDPDTIRTLWNELVPLFASKKLKPLIHTTFSITEAISAFKYMQGAKHIGKVVIEQKPEIKDPLFNPDAIYLITAGLSSLGLELAKWLVARGVRHLALIKRRDPSTSEQEVIDSLGIDVTLFTADVSKYEEVEQVIRKLPDLRGIFHTAGVVDDGIIQHQTWERFEKVFAPKVQGIINFHKATQGIPLDYFVVYSSIVASFGLKGQSNYAAANAFMDGFIAYRRSQNLAGQTINWGPWGEVGMAIRQQMHVPGMHPLTVEQGLEILEEILRTNSSNIIVANMEWPIYLATYPEVPPLFTNLLKTDQVSYAKPKVHNLKKSLEDLPESDREKALTRYLEEKVRVVLNLRESQMLDEKRGFFDIGMDSLMAVELKNQLQQDVKDVTLSQTLIFNYGTLKDLSLYYKESVFPSLFLAEKQVVVEEKKEDKKMTKEEIANLLDEEI